MKNKATITKWLAAILVVILLVTSVMPFETQAATVNGAGSGVSGATLSKSGSYAISAYATDNAVGYRVYVVNMVGEVLDEYPVWDVICSSYASEYTSSSVTAGTMKTKYTKFNIRENYKNRVPEFASGIQTYSGGSGILGRSNTTIDANIGVSFPYLIEDMPGWVDDSKINTLATGLWGLSLTQIQTKNYHVVFELLVDVKIGGVWMTATIAELAMLGVAQSYPGSPYYDWYKDRWYETGFPTSEAVWDYCVGATEYSQNWTFVGRYTHAAWPYALRLSRTQFGFAGGSDLRWLDGEYGGYRYDHASASELIEDGYGMMIVYDYKGYKVHYDGNGATGGSTADSLHLIGTAKALTANGFYKDGHSFAGWATSSGGSVVYSNQQSVKNLTTTPYTTVTLYAKWTPNNYTASFDANGGSSASPGSITKSYGSQLGTLPTTSRTGYTFNGWYTAKSGGSKISTSTKITGNVTYYAQWSINSYTATFDANGGSSASPGSITKSYNSELGTLPTTSRTGYTFNGWYTAKSGGSKISTSTKLTGNVTYYAQWTPNNYYLDLNGYLDGTVVGNIDGFGTADVYINGTLVADDVKDYCTEWPYGTTYEITDIKSTTGHTYNGVYSGSLSGTITGTSYAYLNFTTNYYWLDVVNGRINGANQDTIGDGGTCDVWINGTKVADDVKDWYQQYPYGTTYEINDVKTKTGWTYGGPVSCSLSGTITSDILGWMKFDTNYIWIYYNKNGGSYDTSKYSENEWGWIQYGGTIKFHNVYYGSTTDTYDATTFGLYRTGYTFGGWYMDPPGTMLDQSTQYDSTVYKHYWDGTTTTATATGLSAYLYAVWNPNVVTVNINRDGSAWSGSGKGVKLYSGTTEKYTLSTSGSSATGSGIANGTYNIYAQNSAGTYVDTGVDVAVSNGNASATINYYSLTIAKAAGIASTTPAAGTYNYLSGETATISATASDGYRFQWWEGTSTIRQANTNITMNGAKSYTAVADDFNVDIYIYKDGAAWSDSGKSVQIKMELSDGSTIVYTKYVTSGYTAKFRAVPAGTYDIYAVNSEGEYVDTGVDVAVSAAGGDGSATINYYTVTMAKGTGIESTTPAVGSYIYLSGERVFINAVVSTGYSWSKWSGDFSSTTKNTNVTVNGTKTITANANPNDYSVYVNNFAYFNEAGQEPDWSDYVSLTRSNRFSVYTGESFTLTAAEYGAEVPNGFYLCDSIWHRTAQKYIPVGTTIAVTADFGTNIFDFEYLPYDYNITYNLNGGTNHASNPTVYNILYGVTFEEPTRDGYRFLGWYIGNTKVEGINVGCSASFDDTDDFYTQLASRTTGDITVEAKWEKIGAQYTVHHFFQDIGGSGYTEDTSKRTEAFADFGTTITLADFAETVTGFTYDSAKVGSTAATTLTFQEGQEYEINLYYDRDTYTLTVKPNGGTWSGKTTDQTFTLYYGETKTIADPTRTGYTFTGWSKSGAGSLSGKTYTQGAGNCTITAGWSANDVNFVVRHFLKDLGKSTYTEDTSAKQTLQAKADSTITLADYVATFEGFSYKEGKVNGSVVTTTTVNPDGTLEISLYYNRKVFSVEIYPGTGISDYSGDGMYSYGATVTIDATVAEHYTWSKWTGDIESTTKTYTFTMPAHNVEVTANATPNIYTVALDRQNGTGGSATLYEKYATKFFTSAPSQAAVTSVTTPTRTGYTFCGYYAKTNGGGDKIIDADGTILVGNTYFTSDATIYAYWSANDVTFTVKHFLQDLGKSTYTEDTSARQTLQTKADSTVTLADYVATFEGFSYKEGKVNGTVVTTATVNPDGTLEISLYYTRKSYTLTVKPGSNGIWNGKTGNQTFTLYYGETMAIPDPTSTGYTFEGWSKSGNGTLSDRTYTQGAGNCTLSARWTPNLYTITCDRQTGTNGTAVFYELYGSNFTLNKNITPDWVTEDDEIYSITIPSRVGYTFQGYYTGKNGSGDMIVDADGDIVVGCTYFTSDATIYAKWEANDVDFVVKHFLGNIGGSGYTEDTSARQTLQAKADSTVTLATLKKTYEGFTYSHGQVNSTTVTTTTVNPNGTLEISLYYDRETYDLTVKPNGGTWNGKTTDQTFTLYYGETMTVADPTRVDYDFMGWEISGSGSISGTTFTQGAGDTVLTAKWELSYRDYTVRHFFMDVDGSGYTENTDMREIYTLKTGSVVTVSSLAKTSVTGFTFASGKVGDTVQTSVTINANGIVIDLYYTRQSFTVSLTPGTGIDEVTGAGSYYYGATVKVNAVVATGYTWSKWTGTYTETNKEFTFTMPASNVSLTATATPNTYRIICDDQGATESGSGSFYELYANKFYVNTSTQASVTKVMIPKRTGYTFGGYYTGTNGSGTQVTDGEGNILVSNKFFTSETTVYAYWIINYDVALEEIIFKSSLDPDKAMTVEEVGRVPYGTVVYIQYVYRNNSPVAVTVTGYDTNGNAIEHNGATTYQIPAGETLTVSAGSFSASSLGPGVISGSVYMAGYDNADHEKNDELNGDLAKTNNTRSKTYTVKHDLYIADVYVTHNSANGNVVSMDNLVVGQTYYLHVVYGNNAYSSVAANGYLDADMVTVNGSSTFSIPARGTVDAVVYTYTPSDTGAVSHTVTVYRDGKNSGTETYESNMVNNMVNITLTTIPVPELEVIEMNAPYREGTEVITSYWLRNETNRSYPTGDHVIVRMRVYDSSTGTLLKTMTQNVVVPANESQIVYFKWTVPDISESGDFNIIADIQLPWIGMDPDIWLSRVSDNYGYSPWNVYYTPDTEFEGSAPVGWFAVDAPTATKDNASWHEWSCDESGNFYKRNYGITATPGAVTITPDSKTAFKDESGVWHMKSGYGFFVEVSNPAISVTSGYYMPDSGAYTNAQYSFVAYSEFSYSANTDYIDTMEKVNGHWELYEFMEYGRKHHTPIWYPDGSYIIDVCQTDIWTPMGMITVSTPSSAIIIDGDMYDDWYMGHG